jgi:hypothetical protein
MEELKMKLQQYLQAEENPCCSENSLHEKQITVHDLLL